jgi:hypothetical protein
MKIVLMGDFNEEYGADPEGMIEIATICSLVDVFSPPARYLPVC